MYIKTKPLCILHVSEICESYGTIFEVRAGEKFWESWGWSVPDPHYLHLFGQDKHTTCTYSSTAVLKLFWSRSLWDAKKIYRAPKTRIPILQSKKNYGIIQLLQSCKKQNYILHCRMWHGHEK
jgi:hypothetical protein